MPETAHGHSPVGGVPCELSGAAAEPGVEPRGSHSWLQRSAAERVVGADEPHAPGGESAPPRRGSQLNSWFGFTGGFPLASPLDLIAQAHVQADFLKRFVACLNQAPHTTLEEFYARFLSLYGKTARPGFNVLRTPGSMLGILYVLIVLVKESYYDYIPKTPIADLDPNQWGTIEVRVFVGNQNLRNLVRLLRNAIAHAQIEIDDGLTIRFLGRDKDTETTNFDVSVDLDSVEKLVSDITTTIVNSGAFSKGKEGKVESCAEPGDAADGGA